MSEDWGRGLGVIGHGAGTGTSYGRIGTASSSGTTSIGQPNAVGDLDKAVIRRYVRRRLAHIQYCYEKELVSKPNLSGTLATQFYIAPDGSVAAADANGVDPNVAKCVADEIKHIQFPKPRGGGGVQVNYPFTFRTAGSQIATPIAPAAANQLQAGMTSLLTPPKPVEQWTPVARDSVSDGDFTAANAAAAEIVKTKLPELDRCFDATDATGSLRVMIELDKDKGVTAVRAGGFGDAAAEQCVASAVHAGNFAPALQRHEIACDLNRGAAQPWRVSISKDYTLVGATGAGLVLDGQPRKPGEYHIVRDRAAIVAIEPDANSLTIADALTAAGDAPAALVAMHGKTAELVGMTPPAGGEDEVELTANDGVVHACFRGKDAGGEAAQADASALAAAVRAWTKLCDPKACHLRVVAPMFPPPVLATIAEAVGPGVPGLAADPHCAR